ncbi:Metallo-beta-lactamase superfamily protein [Evansella caseinilytica]|uniref:Metallo-beta-lactamase superfamily protein n=1 Tax=Evansella caseinilytica TaxID=1503961 RepID=A0A1H3Q807_9BACI|nr:MBL fold metallo-hydrolase [Evansella caseinilytica]SDZ09506.1 Metallo-beta-lactamase superfamily protein [Evansella caseinilytica]
MNGKLPSVPADTPQCQLKVMNAGFCRAKKSHILKGADKEEVWLPALFYLIEHPKYGKLLFDTGYSTRFFDVTTKFPFSIMQKLTPVRISTEENAGNQLKRLGIAPEEISIVLLSHLHVDHVGGVDGFPESTFYVNKQEWDYCRQSEWKLFRNGYIKKLFEQVAASALTLLDFEKNGLPYGPFPKTIDLFNDGSIILVPLPGHAVGQYGLMLNITKEERYFLVADSVYVKENYRKERAGSRLSRIAHHDPRRYRQQFSILRQVEEANPGLHLIPSHDPEAYIEFVKTKGISGGSGEARIDRREKN